MIEDNKIQKIKLFSSKINETQEDLEVRVNSWLRIKGPDITIRFPPQMTSNIHNDQEWYSILVMYEE